MIHDLLVEAFKLIQNPNNWIKGHNALAANGLPIDVFDPRAVCFCSEGALIRASAKLQSSSSDYWEAKEALVNAAPLWHRTKPLFRVNDAVTHEQLVEMWNQAIQNAS